MSQYIIQTRDLTKTYGEQKSVSNLNMHVWTFREKWSWKNHNYENAAKPHRTDIRFHTYF